MQPLTTVVRFMYRDEKYNISVFKVYQKSTKKSTEVQINYTFEVSLSCSLLLGGMAESRMNTLLDGKLESKERKSHT